MTPVGDSRAPPEDGDGVPPMSLKTAVRLVQRVAAGCPGGPDPASRVDALIARVQEADGAAWFQGILRRLPSLGLDPIDDLLLVPGMPLETLIRIKEKSKSREGSAAAPATGLAATASYLLAVAAAQARFGKLISSQPRENFREVWLDLATVLPDDWSFLLLKAVDALL